jgi:hypothetical protein
VKSAVPAELRVAARIAEAAMRVRMRQEDRAIGRKIAPQSAG